MPILRALLKHRSVTRAARSLGVSQAAASQGLRRWREMLDDPLLVRIGGRMQLTPRAMELTSRVEAVTAELDDMFRSSQFDPRKAERVLVIAASDYMAYAIGRPMLDLVRSEAPGIRLHFVEIGPDFVERMATRQIDFVLAPRFAVRDYTAAPLRYRTLRREEAGVLMDSANPLAAQTTLSEADFMQCEHVIFWSEGLEQGLALDAEAAPEVAALRRGMIKVAARTSHMTLLPVFLQGTNLIATLPYEICLKLGRLWSMETRRLSFGREVVDHGIAWSPVFDADPAHAWFRTRIEAMATARDRPA